MLDASHIAHGRANALQLSGIERRADGVVRRSSTLRNSQYVYVHLVGRGPNHTN